MLRGRWLAAIAVLALVGAGCGDDDDDDEAAGGDVADYCEAIAEIETAPEPDIDFESASEAEVTAGLKEYAEDTLLPLAKRVQEVAPDEIAEDIDLQAAAVEAVAEDGDFEAAFGEEEAAAEERQHEYDLENCGWGSDEVNAIDYAFNGMDDEYDAGLVSFDMTNGGKEMHELALARKKDDTDESWDEILEMDEEDADELIEILGGLEPTAPGEDGYVVVDLEEGEYIAVCFLPVGATPEVFAALESGQGAPPEGPPHVFQGMRHEFTVS